MKKFFKWAAIVFIALIVIGAVASTSEEEAVDQAVNEAVDEMMDDIEESGIEVVDSEEDSTEDVPSITKADFDKVKNGMTYEEVVEIFGSEGELIAETESPGSEYYSATYDWTKGFDYSVTVVFDGSPATVFSKTQAGLK